MSGTCNYVFSTLFALLEKENLLLQEKTPSPPRASAYLQLCSTQELTHTLFAQEMDIPIVSPATC